MHPEKMRMSDPVRKPGAGMLAAVLVDKRHRVFDGQNFLCSVIRNIATKLFFERHDEFDRIKAVRPEIVNEAGIVGNFALIHAEMLYNNLFNAVCGIAHYIFPEIYRRPGKRRTGLLVVCRPFLAQEPLPETV
tara:strand:- start:223 stop:621 length:399 start_codon:yes stop_codon:yes gene_type:complete